MSRLIVKGLPNKTSEQQLRDAFECFGRLTDVSLKFTKEGVFRKFAFIGFEKEESGKKAIAQLNRTFIRSSRIMVEECLPFTSENKPRPWSKYAKESSAYKRLHAETNGDNLSVPKAESGATKRAKIDENKSPTAKNRGDENLDGKKKKGKDNSANNSKIDKIKMESHDNDDDDDHGDDEKLESEQLFANFLRAQGIPMDDAKEAPQNDASTDALKSVDEKKIANFVASFKGNRRMSLLLRGLPSSLKPKSLREWVAPVKPAGIQYLKFAGVQTVAILTVERSPDAKRILAQNAQFLGGHKVFISPLVTDDEKKRSDSAEPDGNAIDAERAKIIREGILDTGRLFLRNLPYVCTDANLMEAFRKFGEIAELQCIIDKQGKCKGFAIVTFIFPDDALKAFEAMDGSIFKGRMLHILPGESKREPPPNRMNGAPNGRAPLSRFQQERADLRRAEAGTQNNVWNPLYVGANATADALAERLEIGKRELLTGSGDNSAAVRLALAETQLVKQTNEFLASNAIGGNDDDATSNHQRQRRSDTTILVKNMPAGVQFEEELRAVFARFGEMKRIEFAPGAGLSAIVEMGNKVDANRAFNLVAYSRLKGSDQPLYLEWALLKTNDADKKSGHDERSEIKEAEEEEKETEEEKKRTKLLIRNIPFQATLDEVTSLFSAYGELRDVRLPKKVGVRGDNAHRGFGFVDYASHGDARRAISSLKLSTHLYGRRLVVEWARSDATVDQLREKSANRIKKKSRVKGTKKQIRDAVDEHQSSGED